MSNLQNLTEEEIKEKEEKIKRIYDEYIINLEALKKKQERIVEENKINKKQEDEEEIERIRKSIKD